MVLEDLREFLVRVLIPLVGIEGLQLPWTPAAGVHNDYQGDKATVQPYVWTSFLGEQIFYLAPRMVSMVSTVQRIICRYRVRLWFFT